MSVIMNDDGHCQMVTSPFKDQSPEAPVVAPPEPPVGAEEDDDHGERWSHQQDGWHPEHTVQPWYQPEQGYDWGVVVFRTERLRGH